MRRDIHVVICNAIHQRSGQVPPRLRSLITSTVEGLLLYVVSTQVAESRVESRIFLQRDTVNLHH